MWGELKRKTAGEKDVSKGDGKGKKGKRWNTSKYSLVRRKIYKTEKS